MSSIEPGHRGDAEMNDLLAEIRQALVGLRSVLASELGELQQRAEQVEGRLSALEARVRGNAKAGAPRTPARPARAASRSKSPEQMQRVNQKRALAEAKERAVRTASAGDEAAIDGGDGSPVDATGEPG